MLPNFSQYAQQGLAPQIPGLQGFGAPQLNSPLGQPGVYGNAWSGQELVQQGPTWAGSISPFGHNPLAHSPFTQGPSAANSQLVQPVPLLVQLAQQLAIQCAITQQFAQQMSIAVQQLASHLPAQGVPGQYYGQNPYAASVQGGYPGFNPQVQAWGPNRQTTIQ
jgi:hypothetical protein